MADRKITDLTALAAGSQATGDLLTIVDVSEAAATDKNKKITVESLFKGIPGNVGIGATSPSAALEVARTTDMAVIADTTGTNNSARLEARSGDGTTSGKYAYIRFNNNNTNNQRYDVGTYGTDDLTFRDVKAGSTRMTLDTSGRLGIGTSSPSVPLTVNSTPDHSDIAIFHAGGGTPDRGLKVSTFSNTNSNAGVEFDAQHSTGAFRFSTGGTERLRIDSSGNVGIGTTTPSQSWTGGSSRTQQLRGLSGQITVFRVNEAGGTYGDLQLVSTANAEAAVYNFANGSLRFGTNSAERMRITSSGNVGIGDTNPAYELDVASSDTTTVNITAGTTDTSRLFFSDTTIARGYLNYDHTSDSLQIGTASSERMRIRSNGQVEFKNGSFADNIDCVMANNGTMEIGAQTEIKFRTATNERMRLTNNGLTFNGDTAAANALDDYEEGTWTPGVSVGTVNPANAVYTKIGRIVTVSCTLSTFSNRTSTNALIVTGLPFTPSGAGGNDVATGAAFGQYVDQDFSTTYATSTGIYIYGMMSTGYNNIRHSDLNNAAAAIYLCARYIIN
jgi:uncharacterized protein YaiE (UPF0345 family)